MLRQRVKRYLKKVLPVPPLYTGEQEEIQIEVKNALGKVVEKRKEFVPKSRPLTDAELVNNTPADMYDIATLQAAGIKPVTIGAGSYINAGIDALPDVENASAELLYQEEVKASQKASQKANPAPESNTENTNE